MPWNPDEIPLNKSSIEKIRTEKRDARVCDYDTLLKIYCLL